MTTAEIIAIETTSKKPQAYIAIGSSFPVLKFYYKNNDRLNFVAYMYQDKFPQFSKAKHVVIIDEGWTRSRAEYFVTFQEAINYISSEIQ